MGFSYNYYKQFYKKEKGVMLQENILKKAP